MRKEEERREEVGTACKPCNEESNTLKVPEAVAANRGVNGDSC